MQARRWVKTHQASLGLALAAALSMALLILIDQQVIVSPTALRWISDLLPETVGFFLGALITVVWLERAAAQARRARWQRVEVHAGRQAVVDALRVLDALSHEFVWELRSRAVTFDGLHNLDEGLLRDLHASVATIGEARHSLASLVDVLEPATGKTVLSDDLHLRALTTVTTATNATVEDAAVDGAINLFLQSRSVNLVVEVADNPDLSLAALEAMNRAEQFRESAHTALVLNARRVRDHEVWADRASLRTAVHGVVQNAVSNGVGADELRRLAMYRHLLALATLLSVAMFQFVAMIGVQVADHLLDERTRTFWKQNRERFSRTLRSPPAK